MYERKYERVLVKLNEGDTLRSEKINLARVANGKNIIAFATKFNEKTPNVSIELKTNNKEIHPAMSIKFFDGNFGNLDQRGLELAYNGGATVTVNVKSENGPITAEQAGLIEVNFLLYLEC